MPSAFYLRPVFYSFWSGFEWFGSILKYFPFRLEGRFILRGPQCGLPSLIMWLWDAGWQCQSDPHACSPPGPCRRSHLPQRHPSRSAPTCSPRPLSVSPNSTPPGTSSKRNDARPVLLGLAGFARHPVLGSFRAVACARMSSSHPRKDRLPPCGCLRCGPRQWLSCLSPPWRFSRAGPSAARRAASLPSYERLSWNHFSNFF